MKYTLLEHGIAPTIGTSGSAGIDFFSPSNYEPTILYPKESILIPTGVKVLIPKGMVGIFYNRSSLGSKGIILGAKVVDSDYRGEVFINLINVSSVWFSINPCMKIAQMVVTNYHNSLHQIDLTDYDKYSTIRGQGCLGSTDK